MNNTLINLQARLKPGCNLQLKFDGDNWEAAIVTEGNRYPHWVQYQALTPKAALAKIVGFLDGSVPDHARDSRPPLAFLKAGCVAVVVLVLALTGCRGAHVSADIAARKEYHATDASPVDSLVVEARASVSR